jgi:membrane protein YqaA with SNARE-associated domain
VTYLLTIGVAFVSAWLPVVNIEVYLVGLLATTSVTPWSMSLAAAAGQTGGKVLMFLSARGVLASPWVRRRLQRGAGGRAQRWTAWVTARAEGWVGVAVVLLSAVVGLPPLLLVSVVAGTTRMPVLAFAGSCLVGRWLRFFLLLTAPGVLFDWP